jgi:outer membrane biosynthesis protein TonB
MRSGVVISTAVSAALHVALVSFLILSAPRRLHVMEAPVEVDLVRADEIETPKDEPKPESEKKKEFLWDIPRESPSPDRKSASELPKVTPPSSQSSPSQQPSSSQPAPSSSQPASQQSQSAPSNSQQAALTPPQSTSASLAQQQPSPPPKDPPSVFDPVNIPRLMDIANTPSSGFDSETTVTANISDGERAAFKTHLRKCWKLAEGAAPATRVVLRVYLKPNGALASDPVLIEASASHDGPAVLKAAMRALKTCQPYGFLSPDKYSEWKILDLTFTPRDMAGG